MGRGESHRPGNSLPGLCPLNACQRSRLLSAYRSCLLCSGRCSLLLSSSCRNRRLLSGECVLKPLISNIPVAGTGICLGLCHLGGGGLLLSAFSLGALFLFEAPALDGRGDAAILAMCSAFCQIIGDHLIPEQFEVFHGLLGVFRVVCS